MTNMIGQKQVIRDLKTEALADNKITMQEAQTILSKVGVSDLDTAAKVGHAADLYNHADNDQIRAYLENFITDNGGSFSDSSPVTALTNTPVHHASTPYTFDVNGVQTPISVVGFYAQNFNTHLKTGIEYSVNLAADKLLALEATGGSNPVNSADLVLFEEAHDQIGDLLANIEDRKSFINSNDKILKQEYESVIRSLSEVKAEMKEFLDFDGHIPRVSLLDSIKIALPILQEIEARRSSVISSFKAN